MEVNSDNYVLCVTEENQPVTKDDGRIYLSNIHVNLTHEIATRFNVEIAESAESTEEVNEASEPCRSIGSSASGQWSREAILELTDSYKRHERGFKNTIMKRAKVWAMVSDNMNKNGFRDTPLQCEHKLKYLQARYVKKEENAGTKGTEESPFRFDYYDEFDELFGNKPNIEPPVVVGSLQKESTPLKRSDDSDKQVQAKKKLKTKEELADLTKYLQGKHTKAEEDKERRHKERLESADET